MEVHPSISDSCSSPFKETLAYILCNCFRLLRLIQNKKVPIKKNSIEMAYLRTGSEVEEVERADLGSFFEEKVI